MKGPIYFVLKLLMVVRMTKGYNDDIANSISFITGKELKVSIARVSLLTFLLSQKTLYNTEVSLLFSILGPPLYFVMILATLLAMEGTITSNYIGYHFA